MKPDSIRCCGILTARQTASPYPHAARKLWLPVEVTSFPRDLESRFNVRTGHLYMHLNYYAPGIARRLKRFKALQLVQFPRIRISDAEVEQLYSLYHEENRKLEELLGRSLSIWSQDRIPGQPEAGRRRRNSG